jgi:hypothetical protein
MKGNKLSFLGVLAPPGLWGVVEVGWAGKKCYGAVLMSS